jgi:UDP-2,4-diacetamido-2,4,6-trideoxy-beta-L-altropyranose hydrolase
MTVSGNLLIRCDASVAIGTGHVMRCLALAQAWNDSSGHAVVAMAETTPAVEERVHAEKFDVVRLAESAGSAGDAERTARLARQEAASWVVVDGYVFGAAYQACLRRAGLKVLFLDDNGHAEHYSADLVLNQNPHARAGLYPSREPGTRLLLGSQFALLRREFRAWAGWGREIPLVARKVLVTLGGSDPDNVTGRVARAILSERELEGIVVAGGSNPHVPKLRRLTGESERVRLVQNADNMPELMAWADVAVSGAGTTSWEICFMGLPALLIVLADNQEPVARELGEQGTVLNLGRGAAVTEGAIMDRLRSVISSHNLRQAMSGSARTLIDGRGAERVVAAMLSRFADGAL